MSIQTEAYSNSESNDIHKYKVEAVTGATMLYVEFEDGSQEITVNAGEIRTPELARIDTELGVLPEVSE
jgi:hypothetical protein